MRERFTTKNIPAISAYTSISNLTHRCFSSDYIVSHCSGKQRAGNRNVWEPAMDVLCVCLCMLLSYGVLFLCLTISSFLSLFQFSLAFSEILNHSLSFPTLPSFSPCGGRQADDSSYAFRTKHAWYCCRSLSNALWECFYSPGQIWLSHQEHIRCYAQGTAVKPTEEWTDCLGININSEQICLLWYSTQKLWPIVVQSALKSVVKRWQSVGIHIPVLIKVWMRLANGISNDS